jgi:hypothetical protein
MTPTLEVLVILARRQAADSGDHWEVAETLRGECRGRSASSIARSLAAAHDRGWVDRRYVGGRVNRTPYWRINDAGRAEAARAQGGEQ